MVGGNEQLAYFEANVDASAGSSGSAVFNLDTLEVEGILVAGVGDFDFGSKCDRSLALSDSYPVLAAITRATAFSHLIPSYDIYLGTEPDHLELVAEDIVAPYFSAGGLEPDTTYFWRIIARNIAGETQSPVWTFTTRP